MNKYDFVEFSKIWVLTCEQAEYSKHPSQELVSMTFDDLSFYSLSEVKSALAVHRRTSRAVITVAAVIENIRISNFHILPRLGANEAWAGCPTSDLDTVVWTIEMAQAFEISQQDSDIKGQKFTFMEAYKRLCREADAIFSPVVWVVNVGDSPAGRGEPIRSAVKMGRISTYYGGRFIDKQLADSSSSVVKLLTNQSLSDEELIDIPTIELEKIRAILNRPNRLSIKKEKSKSNEKLERERVANFINESKKDEL